ncbi:hypothetical protein [Mycobacterium sp. PSTR-4-N]|uniref:hypothetical protein n=1 Tax=Mycobacterium sp. PSTR-4-N TaxID=2917745 RepID=UPI001F1530DA|nr:hypothetical protein [Mycobacterium sp. PSTR-4-N]MCG7592416.1 hypothetical protein [Mycobacterium sp. PSTR-4-N]
MSWDARLVLKGLESYVDDNGVGKDDVELIIGDLFQRDAIREPSRTLARVSEALCELADAGLIWRYEAAGTSLLYVSFWEDIQRVDKPQSGRLPRPDGTMDYKSSSIRESVANPREPSRNVAPGTGEQGNRGTGATRTPVRTEPHSAEPEPTAAASATPGADLVRANITQTHPAATLTSLRHQASELVNTETDPEIVAAALRLWEHKPNIGIGRTILASLCSEVIKTRAAPAANGHPAPSAFDRKKAANGAVFAALADQPHVVEIER